MVELVDRLAQTHRLTKDELISLIDHRTPELSQYLFQKSAALARSIYGRDIYVRGLTEFTNYCKNDCYYCGIRCSNKNASRYRLTKADILACCARGYELGFRTFVLQGGEDPLYRDVEIAAIVTAIKCQHPGCAVTLSVGEKPRATYQMWFDAGADRYLLRHETINPLHYARLHPPRQTIENRVKCLYDLKEIGYQVGCGMMVQSPFQTTENIAEDLLFMAEFQPHMVGIGPFIPHHDTPFRAQKPGSVELTLFLLGVIRLMLPEVLLPATTALGTLDPTGREKGVLAGANVVMPNLSPLAVREKYMLYDGKISTGDEAAEALENLRARMEKIGYRVVPSRGDHKAFVQEENHR